MRYFSTPRRVVDVSVGDVDSRPSEILGVLYQHQTIQEHYILVERRMTPVELVSRGGECVGERG